MLAKIAYLMRRGGEKKKKNSQNLHKFSWEDPSKLKLVTDV